ncbi:MAG: hypothetical protein IKR11_06445 [Solobacterium sp.]|nr:hypothetical protein [Solobacterium sp.]
MRVELEKWVECFGTPIYVIWLCEKLVFKGETWPDPNEPARLVHASWKCDEEIEGFYHSKELAMDLVKANVNDMWDGCWKYALVEEIYPGLSHFRAENRWLFKHDHKNHIYVEIELPVLKDDEEIMMD